MEKHVNLFEEFINEKKLKNELKIAKDIAKNALYNFEDEDKVDREDFNDYIAGDLYNGFNLSDDDLSDPDEFWDEVERQFIKRGGKFKN